MRVAIIGCGWVGERLAPYLKSKNYTVLATTTSPEKIEFLKEIASEVHLLDFNLAENFDFLNDVDVVIFSMPISRNSWHEGYKIYDKKFPKTILFSSTGIYPNENGTYSERQTENLRSDISASENLVREKFPQTNILRFGGLMGDERNLQKLFKNRSPENPEKATNYIHYEDILAIVEIIFKSEKKSEIYNLVAPEHPTIAEVLGSDQEENSYISEKSSRIVSSEKLIQNFNYKFIHPNPKYF